MRQHRQHVAIGPLVEYIVERTGGSGPFAGDITALLDATSKAEVGFVVSARVMNLPVQVIPPTYTMLLEEIQWAIDDKEQYQFTHYLVLSKTYVERAATVDTEDVNRARQKKKKTTRPSPEMFYFHAEDEIMQNFASSVTTFPFKHNPGIGAADSRRAFHEEGIDPQGYLMLFDAAQFTAAVRALSSALNDVK